MSSYLVFALLGLGPGAVLSMLAIGVLLGYKGSGVVNFSQGAIAMYVAYVWYGLRETGRYLLPVPGLPAWVSVGTRSVWPALVLSLLTAAILGLILHWLVIRPIRNAPVLTRVVSTIGFMLLLQAIIGFRFGSDSSARQVPRLLPRGAVVRILDVNISADQFVLPGVAIGIAVLLAGFYRYTRFGLATRAAAESEEAASVLGYSPDFQAGINWIGASVLAGFSGILIAPLTTLTPTAFNLLIIPALAAALVGRFTSFTVTAVAGLLIGMAQAVFIQLPNTLSWFPKVGAASALPFVVIIIAMFFVGTSLPTRGVLAAARLPAVPMPTTGSLRSGATFIVLVGALSLVMTSTLRVAIINTAIAAVLCLSIVVLTGFVGQISLFPMALVGVSAYVLAAISKAWHIPFPLAPILATLAAAVVGLLAAMPALRVRGVNLAVITLAGGYAIETFFFSNPLYTGGSFGASVPPPRLFGLHLEFARGATIGTAPFMILVLAVLSLLSLVVINIRRNPTGRRMLALRSNERAAAAAGVNVSATKFIAFGVSSCIAGMGGCLVAYEQTQLTGPFDSLYSISIFAVAYIGGITSVSGAIAAGLLAPGAFFFYIYTTYVFGQNALQIITLISGLGLILTAILNPEGMSGALRHEWHRARSKVRAASAKARQRTVKLGGSDGSDSNAGTEPRTPSTGVAAPEAVRGR